MTLRDFAILSRDLTIASGLLIFVIPIEPWAMIICRRFEFDGFFSYLLVAVVITILMALPLVIVARIFWPIDAKERDLR